MDELATQVVPGNAPILGYLHGAGGGVEAVASVLRTRLEQHSLHRTHGVRVSACAHKGELVWHVVCGHDKHRWPMTLEVSGLSVLGLVF